MTSASLVSVDLIGVAADAPATHADLAHRVGRARWLPSRDPRSRRRIWLAVVAALVALAAAGAPLADEDSFGDLVRSMRSVAGGVGAVRWQFLPILGFVAALHYGFAAVALRAASGARLPLGATTLAQLAASTANRLTPAGLGGAAVNVRYLTRRGTGAAPAVSAVAALGVLGAVADLLLIVLLVVAGSWVGLSGGNAELTSLGGHLTHFLTLPKLSTSTVAVVGAIAVVVILAVILRLKLRRRHDAFSMASRLRSVQRAVIDTLRHLADLLHRPRDLATLLVASSGTTLMMGLAFAVSVSAIPGSTGGSSTGVILVAYLLGAAAGSAVPSPSGIGSTEATLVAALVIAHVPAAHALQSVLLFRLVSFWAPAIAGLPAARVLRARGAL